MIQMVIYFNLRYKLDPTENGLRADYDDGFDKETVNIYEIIEQKENDLLLAAELGTALLDKNEEISRHREKIVMDYTQKMEVFFTVIKSEIFYLNTIEQVFLLVEQLDQLVVCLTYSSRLLTGIPILAVFQNLRWN